MRQIAVVALKTHEPTEETAAEDDLLLLVWRQAILATWATDHKQSTKSKRKSEKFD